MEIPDITVPNIRAVLTVQNKILAETNNRRKGQLIRELLQAAESEDDNGTGKANGGEL